MEVSYQLLAIFLLMVQVISCNCFVILPKSLCYYSLSSTTANITQHHLLSDGTEANNDIAPSHDVKKVVFLLPNSSVDPTLQDSIDQIVSKLESFCDVCAATCSSTNEVDDVSLAANVLIALGVESPPDVRCVATTFRLRRSAGKKGTCQFALGGKPFAPLLDEYDEANPTWQQDIPWTAAGKDKKLLLQMQALFEKEQVESYVEAVLLYLDEKGT